MPLSFLWYMLTSQSSPICWYSRSEYLSRKGTCNSNNSSQHSSHKDEGYVCAQTSMCGIKHCKQQHFIAGT